MRTRKLVILVVAEVCFLTLLILLLMRYPAFCVPKTSEDTQQTGAAPSSSQTQETQSSLPTQPEQESTETTIPDDTQPEPLDTDFVKVKDYIPDAIIDLPYATSDNFTKTVIYQFSDCYLRYGTVKKLMSVQEQLKQSGFRLKIWDGFRPFSAQEKLWEICPDPTYVSNPATGSNSHCKGNTVDITLVYADGSEVKMPTGFDDFTGLADRDYSDCDEESKTNAEFLEQLMTQMGFKPYFGEWWHFSDTTDYPVDKEFLKQS